jgi:ParB-like chromosome segregation protein Spo0J
VTAWSADRRVLAVASPVKGKGHHYRIVSGERRFRALKLLQERGEVPEDFAVPVEIRSSLSKDDSLRLATVENLQGERRMPKLIRPYKLSGMLHEDDALHALVTPEFAYLLSGIELLLVPRAAVTHSQVRRHLCLFRASIQDDEAN